MTPIYVTVIVDIDRGVNVDAYSDREAALAAIREYLTTYHEGIFPGWAASTDDLMQWHNETTVPGEFVDVQPTYVHA